MNAAKRKSPPDALLLIASGCPHCPTVLQGLAELVKHGVIGSLEVVNIAVAPERAAKLKVRSVPWTRIGPFELEGLRSSAELRRWAERAGTTEGLAEYFDELLSGGQLKTAERLVREDPTRLSALALLAGNPDTGIATRVGIGALLEGLHGSGLAGPLVQPLAELVHSEDARVRADAAHYLALTENTQAIGYLKALSNDDNANVREIAAEGLENLRSRSPA